jgi:hypothetical protein
MTADTGDSVAAPPAPPPPPEQAFAQKSPQQYFTELRQWVLDHCGTGNAVRQSAYQMSLTAYVHRLIKYGPDDSLNHLTSVDLLHLLLYTNAETAEWLMRAAFTRSLIEGRQDIVDYLASLPFMPECTNWYWKLTAGIIGAAEDPAETTAWLDSMPPEEKSIARLLIARVYPDTAHIDWLHDVPAEQPLLAYKLAELIATQPKYKHAAECWVRERPLVRNQAYN